jgi:hypothetical protein
MIYDMEFALRAKILITKTHIYFHKDAGIPFLLSGRSNPSLYTWRSPGHPALCNLVRNLGLHKCYSVNKFPNNFPYVENDKLVCTKMQNPQRTKKRWSGLTYLYIENLFPFDFHETQNI